MTSQEYYLHVRDNGDELRFNHKPHSLPTMTVTRKNGYEFTTTNSISRSADPTVLPKPVLPKGEDWHFWENRGNCVVWRRPIKRLPR
jgi:hypothetical protein